MAGILQAVRYVGYAEGTSFLLLLGIAMPLKYAANRPEGVLVVGWAHGVLFVMYAVVVFTAYFMGKLSFLKVLGAALASLLPFGPFVYDARLRREEKANAGLTTEVPTTPS